MNIKRIMPQPASSPSSANSSKSKSKHLAKSVALPSSDLTPEQAIAAKTASTSGKARSATSICIENVIKDIPYT